jgi:predicted aldo/keto reductase-like oxidoreductase
MMQYNKLGRTGLDVGILGLGMEHLQSPEPDQVIPVVHRALDAGMNYIDIMIWNAEPQVAFGQALRGRRDKVILAGHLGVGQTRGQYRRTRKVPECETLFHDLLNRLGTDHVDVLHLSYVDAHNDYKRVVGPGGVLELARRLKEEGKARFIGLSGHNPDTATRAIQSGIIDVLMHPIGMGQADRPKMVRLCHLCASQGIGLVAMKAFNGGALFQRDRRPTVAQCLSYTLAQAGVCTAALGARNREELDADLAYLEASEAERDFAPALAEIQEARGSCVYCGHCLPCPVVIDIPVTLRLLVTAQQGPSDAVRATYNALGVHASACTECGACVKRCPFGVAVIDKMRQALAMFGQ